MTLMRGTIHLVTDRDCLALRPALQSVWPSGCFWSGQPVRQTAFGASTSHEVVAAGRAHNLEMEPLTRSQLKAAPRRALARRDADSLAYAVATSSRSSRYRPVASGPAAPPRDA